MTETRWFFEDFKPGDRHALRPYVLDKRELIEFALKYDPQPFHTDEAAALQSPLGVLCASGVHTFVICQRLGFDAIYSKAASIAGAGVDNVTFLRPVLPGDVLSGEAVIQECRASRSKPDRGIVNVGLSMRNDRGQEVATMSTRLMVLRRPE